MSRCDSLIGAIDQGTSSSRFLVFEGGTGKVVAHHQIEVSRNCPQQGWVEEDPSVLLTTVLTCIEKTVEKLKEIGRQPEDIKAIGVTTQRQTIIAWDKNTGEPLYQAILWCDTRTCNAVEEIQKRPYEENAGRVKTISGVPVVTFTSALKIRWLLDNVPKVQVAVQNGRCLVGNVDSWLIWNITGGTSGGIHMTDVTNASGMQLMNLKTLKWDPFLCEYFNIPQSILPAIKSSSEIYGTTRLDSLFNIPISASLGDQQAALIGQMCLKSGEAKCTYGTGSFLVCNIGEEMVLSNNGLLTQVGYQLGPDTPPVYVLEGSIAAAGASIRWLRDNLGISSTYEELDVMATRVKDCGGVYFVPAFSGLFSPYWSSDARGVICGLTEHTTKCHIARSAFDATAYQVRDVVEALNKEGYILKSLNVDGGMSKNEMFMQFQSDILGIELFRPDMAETTALGVAMAAGSAKGIDIVKIPPTKTFDKNFKIVKPKMSQQDRDSFYFKWKHAVSRSLGWKTDADSTKVN